MNDAGKNKKVKKPFVSEDNKDDIDNWYKRYMEAVKREGSVEWIAENKSTAIPFMLHHRIAISDTTYNTFKEYKKKKGITI